MTPKQLKQKGKARHGKKWQSALANELGINPRTVRGWLQGRSPIPTWLEVFLNKALPPYA